jgi:transposase
MSGRDGNSQWRKDKDVVQGDFKGFGSRGVESSFLETGQMIQITPQMQIWVAVEAVDFRRGIDGLAQVCREVLKADPFSGYLFVFRNKRGTAMKILTYDTQGFWLCQKRLSRGRFRWWPRDPVGKRKSLMAHELQLLIWNGNPAGGEVAPLWKKLPGTI